MIVKNESEMLAGCLESVRAAAEEIIVVDTGSADCTMEIAERCGARVLSAEWRDDYSAARNISLRAAGQSWILVLDADERIAAKDHGRLRQLIDGPKAGYLFTQRHYGTPAHDISWHRCEGQYPDYEAGFEGFGMGELTRLFPNEPGITFSGIVYEFVEPSIRANTPYPILRSHIPIHHYGNTAARRSERQKDAYYHRLAKKKAELEASPQAWMDLGTMAQIVGELDEAEEALRRFAASRPGDLRGLVRLAEVLAQKGKFTEAVDHFLQALCVDNLDPLVHLKVGMLYLSLRRFIFAEAHLQRAAELCPGLVQAQHSLRALEAARESSRIAVAVTSE